MKIPKTLIYLFAFLVGGSFTLNLLSFKSKAENEHEPLIMMEIYEIPAYHGKGIHIYYGNGDFEIIPFKPFKEENQEKNGDIIVTTLNRLAKEGYKITFTSSGLSDSGMITKVFLKKD